jgi:protochlorophyllide reductase
MPDDSYVTMKLELGSLQSVRDFVANLKAFKSARPLTNLICNAAVYKPKDPEPVWTDDGFEMSMGVNHLGHFLLVNLLLDDMSKAKDPRLCIVGSITGNTNTVGGGLVYPFADLGNLKGLESGMQNPVSMADGKPFFGAKAYKDSKVRWFDSQLTIILCDLIVMGCRDQNSGSADYISLTDWYYIMFAD